MSASPFGLKSDPFANTVSHLLSVARPAVMCSFGGSSSIRVKPKMVSHCKAMWSTHLVNAWTEWCILGVAIQKLTWHVGTTMIPLWSTLFTAFGSRRWPLMSFRFRTIFQWNTTIWRCMMWCYVPKCDVPPFNILMCKTFRLAWANIAPRPLRESETFGRSRGGEKRAQLAKTKQWMESFEGRVDAFPKSLLTPLTAVFLWSQWHMGSFWMLKLFRDLDRHVRHWHYWHSALLFSELVIRDVPVPYWIARLRSLQRPCKRHFVWTNTCVQSETPIRSQRTENVTISSSMQSGFRVQLVNWVTWLTMLSICVGKNEGTKWRKKGNECMIESIEYV